MTHPVKLESVKPAFVESSARIVLCRAKLNIWKDRPQILGGAEYFLTFLDDKTHYTWVYSLKNKDQVFEFSWNGR